MPNHYYIFDNYHTRTIYSNVQGVLYRQVLHTKIEHVQISETGHLIKSNILAVLKVLVPQSALKLISDVFEPQCCS